MANATYAETQTSLVNICSVCLRALYELGQIRGRNDTGSGEELLALVIDSSKQILNRLPCLQLENDGVETADSNYAVALNRLASPLQDTNW